jgi:hypothetical protein
MIRTRQRHCLVGRLLVAKVVYGVALVATVTLVPRRSAAAGLDHHARIVAGAIGARSLVEATIIGKRPTPTTVTAVAAIDTMHAASMLAVAITRPNRHRLAAGSAVAAGLFAAATAALRSATFSTSTR